MLDLLIMCSFAFFGVIFLVSLMRMIEFLAECALPVSPPPRTGEFQTRWVYEDEELWVRKRQ